MIKRTCVSILTSVIIVLFTGALVYAEDVFKIGSIYSITGPAAHLANMALRGQQMAVEELNSKGGVSIGGKKYKIEAINYDDRCSAKDAVSIAERLMNNDKVPILVAPTCSHATLAVMELNEKQKIPMVVSMSASMKVTSMGNKYIFRFVPQSAMQTEAITKYVIEDLKLKKGAYIGRNDAWGKSVGDQFKKRIEARGGKVVASEYFELGATDFYSILTKIKMADPEFIWLLSLAEDGAQVVKQAREIGIKSTIIGTDELINDQAFKIAGSALEGVYTYYYGGPARPESLAYEKVFAKKYGEQPTNHSKLGYDAVMLIVDAAKRAGSLDSIKLRDALAGTKLFKGISGSYSFTVSGQATSAMWMARIKNQKADFIKDMHIDKNPPLPIDRE
jgi:branched-chain amino acid transport system substrate-binding protein